MKSKGFTLIELLVVIAIIGILAALVLVALGNARDKANDARVKANLGQLRTLAEVLYDSAGASYVTVETCFDTPTTANCSNDAATAASVLTLNTDTNTANGTAGGVPTAESTAAGFCVEAALLSGRFVCVDSTGVTVDTQTTGRCTAVDDVSCQS